MADYTKLAKTGEAIVALLKEALVPELLNSPDQIGLCSPEEHGDYVVGIWLYDVKESADFKTHDMVDVNYQSQQYPSVFMEAYYMITLYLQSDLKYRAGQEHQMIGKIIQTLRDKGVLDAQLLTTTEDTSGVNIRIEMQDLKIEEKMHIWTVPNAAYKASLFYKAGPIEIKSTRKKTVRRVRDIQYRFTN